MFSTQTSATLLLAFLSHLAIASQQPQGLQSQDLELRGEGGGWTNAYCISSNQQDLTAATSAQCPSWAPINCNAIQEPNYCCTPSTYCARASDNTIGCCPWGQTCNPIVAGGGVGTWQPQQTSTIWQQPQPSTVYVTEVQPTTTLVYAAGQNTQQVTTVYNGVGEGQGQGQYCSTLYAHGGNLPTTEAGTCGTILIANAAVKGAKMSTTTLICALLAFGGVALRIRV